MRVAIVGMGISGMGVLNAYYKEQVRGVEIDCYDSAQSFGRGFPFRRDTKYALLNVRPEIIGFDHEHPEEFKKWLDEQPAYRGQEYVPRFAYGEFLHEQAGRVIEKLSAHAYQEMVEDLDYSPERQVWKLKTAKREKEYDRIHLCCGELAYADHYNLKGQPGYVHELYPMSETLNNIPFDAKVGIIGTSLSAIDALRYLYRRGDSGNGDDREKQNRISIFSNRNIFPTARQKGLRLQLEVFTTEKIKAIKKKQNGFISFEQTDALLKEEYRARQLDLEKIMKKYDSGFGAIEKSLGSDQELRIVQNLNIENPFNEAWFGMDLENKAKFKKLYSRYLTLFFSPIPADTGKLLVKMKQSGYLNVLTEVGGIEVVLGKQGFRIFDKNKRNLTEVDYLINATGQDSSLRSLSKDSLLGRLINKEIISAYTFGGVNVLPRTSEVLSPRYGHLNSLFAHGVLTKGAELVNNGTILIQAIAHEKVQNSLEKK